MASLRRRTSRGVRAAAAVASLVLGGVALFAGTASAGTTGAAAGSLSPAASQAFPAVRPAGVPAGATLEAHNCAVIHRVDDATEESVHCADIWWENISEVENAIWAGNEVLCQNLAGALEDCPSISETVQFTSPQFSTQTQSGACGTRIGHSDCGARRIENVTPVTVLNPFLTSKCSFTSAAVDTVDTYDGANIQRTITANFTTNC
jgi:hypothetical protein